MKILLIGKNGMLGSDIMLFLDHLPEVELISTGHEDLDITDSSAVSDAIATIKPGLVINAAGATHVDNCEDDQDWAFKLNADAVGHIAKACSMHSSRFIHFSTDYVFDGKKAEGYNEDDTPNPISVYGKSKLKGEENALSECAQTHIIRVCWLFGKNRRNFVDFLMEVATKDAEVTLIKDQWGHPSYTKDLAEGLKQFIIPTPDTSEFGIYHLFNEGSPSRLEQGKYVFELLQKTPKITEVGVDHFAGKAPRPMYSILNSSKIKPLRNWKEATKEYVSLPI